MKDDTHTGCGIFPAIINDECMGPACQWHDEAYTKGSWHQANMTRKQVDDWFLRIMLECAKTAFERARAHIYYRIVRAVGGIFWEGSLEDSYD